MPKEQNMKHAECCERVNKLKIRGTKCEPLYLQLLMTSLKSGGLCAVIVPKSLLISDSSCHIETRKYLLKNFELKNIIEMNRTYIIYFENSGRPTTSYTIKSGYYTDEMFLPGRQIWPVNPNSVKPGTKIIDVKYLENTTYNLLEIKKIEEVKKEDELVCDTCAKCIEKDKIIEELKTKLKAIRELSTISNKN
jgi:type I restriction-modification system DNA methylase subunit